MAGSAGCKLHSTHPSGGVCGRELITIPRHLNFLSYSSLFNFSLLLFRIVPWGEREQPGWARGRMREPRRSRAWSPRREGWRRRHPPSDQDRRAATDRSDQLGNRSSTTIGDSRGLEYSNVMRTERESKSVRHQGSCAVYFLLFSPSHSTSVRAIVKRDVGTG